MALPTHDLLMLLLKLKGFWQRRSLGQHYLTDAALLARIAELAGCDRETVAIEIGAGPGTLTTELGARAGRVLALDIDDRLRPVHEEAFGPHREIEFIYADALRIDLAARARAAMAEHGLTRAVLTGNLPFQITSPLMFAQCGPGLPWARLAVMVQREVGERMLARPGTREYGVLTVKMAYWWRPIEHFVVSAESFFPRPKVDAAVVAFDPAPLETRPSPEEWADLSPFIDAVFNQRRKMLFNTLAGAWKGYSNKDATMAAMAELGLDSKVRGEALDASTLRALLGALRRHGAAPAN